MLTALIFVAQDVRRTLLATLNTLLHHTSTLVISRLPVLAPWIFKQTQVDPALIRDVEMGPFKHKVDDGLDVRKSAFDCLYSIMEIAPYAMPMSDFVGSVCSGLSDVHDISLLSQLMVLKLCTIAPEAVLQSGSLLVSAVIVPLTG